MADKFGIIYAAGSKAVRRIVVSDDPNYDYSLHAGPGEGHVIADTKGGTDVFSARAALEEALGVKSPEPLVAVVKNGSVVSLTMADPVLDTIPGHELIPAYSGVFVGCTYNKESGTFTTPDMVIPAVIDNAGNQFPEKTVGGLVVGPKV